MLDFTILWRGVWVGHRQDDPTGGKECAGASIVELTVVVTLDGIDGAAKLRRNRGEKFDNVGKVSNITCIEKVHTK
jgi:hypothetical protein